MKKENKKIEKKIFPFIASNVMMMANVNEYEKVSEILRKYSCKCMPGKFFFFRKFKIFQSIVSMPLKFIFNRNYF